MLPITVFYKEWRMTFDELLTKVRTIASGVDASDKDFLAVQVNFTDSQNDVMYVEIKDGKVNIAPYEYNDRSCAISISKADFTKLLAGKLDPIAAFTIGKLKVDGDIGKALEFSKLLKK